MFAKSYTRISGLCLILGSQLTFINAQEPAGDSAVSSLPTLVVDIQATANVQPVTTYETPVSSLEFEPRVDLQSRNMAEAQGDVSIRGGIFENTGFVVGSATLYDPQTGHYSAELPIAPEMLIGPKVLTGVDNALLGFNSTVGSLSYGWSQISPNGSFTAGGGNNALNFQRLYQGWTHNLSDDGDWTLGLEAEVSRSESDGTIEYGDHDFDRSSGRIQLLGPDSQTDFFAGYQAKFFGWPGMYTPNPANLETENLKTRLFILNHAQNYGDASNLELSAYHRRHSDNYVYQRYGPSTYQAHHETNVTALAVSGLHSLNNNFKVNYAGQITSDEIESTTLEKGDFISRTYYKISLLPEYRFDLEDDQSVTIKAGASFDDTNRDESEISPLAEISWLKNASTGKSERVYLSYAQTTQVAGYGAIGGSTSGLFASNPSLSREISENIEVGLTLKRADWSLETAIFYRWDDDLTDWTFSNSAPTARTANPVDIETFGFEIIGTKSWSTIEAIASYTYLHKDEDYGIATIDASFYALNFPEHRATLGTIWRPIDLLEVRIDNEWRSQKANALRSGPDESFYTLFGLSVYPPQYENLELFFAIDKPWDEDFQDVPGTPGRGDQYSAGATLRW